MTLWELRPRQTEAPESVAERRHPEFNAETRLPLPTVAKSDRRQGRFTTEGKLLKRLMMAWSEACVHVVATGLAECD
jgi:hypothetical protein